MIVELLKSGKKATEVGKQYSIDPSLIRKWKKSYDEKRKDSSKPSKPKQETTEVKLLKKKLKEAELERDILKKAVSIFSKSDG